jgi:hypothetical protein
VEGVSGGEGEDGYCGSQEIRWIIIAQVTVVFQLSYYFLDPAYFYLTPMYPYHRSNLSLCSFRYEEGDFLPAHIQ